MLYRTVLARREGRKMAFNISAELASEIVSAVRDVCDHNINFIDTEGIIFASTDKKRIGKYHEIGRKVARTGQTIEVAADNSFPGTHKGVNIPLVFHNEVKAVIGISGDPREVGKYAYLAGKIAGIILKEHELDQMEQIRKVQLNQLVRSLIHNEYVNREYFSQVLKKYKLDENGEYCTIAVRIGKRGTANRIKLAEDRVYRVFERTGSGLYTVNYSEEYILILPWKNRKQWEFLFQELAEDYRTELKIGIGSSERLGEQHESYKNALLAIQSLTGEANLAFYHQLNLELLLGDISEEVRKQYVARNLQGLDQEDRQLLNTYFQLDMSLKKTCDRLYLHKNTLQYKLNRIWKLTGLNPRKFRDGVVLYMALKVEGAQSSYISGKKDSINPQTIL